MPSSQVKTYLRQLKKEELLSLAKRKRVRIPESWTKRKIVETLSTIVSKKDVMKAVSKRPKAKTKEALGYERKLKGITLEDKVVKIFKKKGYECTKNIRLRGAEIDIVGMKKGGWFSDDEYVVIECKNKARVTPADFKKFIGNMNLYIKKKKLNKDNVIGYLYTTGVFDADVKSQARAFPNIKLKRVKL